MERAWSTTWCSREIRCGHGGVRSRRRRRWSPAGSAMTHSAPPDDRGSSSNAGESVGSIRGRALGASHRRGLPRDRVRTTAIATRRTHPVARAPRPRRRRGRRRRTARRDRSRRRRRGMPRCRAGARRHTTAVRRSPARTTNELPKRSSVDIRSSPRSIHRCGAREPGRPRVSRGSACTPPSLSGSVETDADR